MSRKNYPSDVTNEQWSILADLIPPAKRGGRSRNVDVREIINGIFYLTHNGCTWRALPHDLPPWQTVATYFYKWQRNGTWKKINDTLRRQVRVKEGREEEPTAGIIDSQSVKTTEKGGLKVMMRVRR